MQRPMLGHLDPDLHDLLLEIVELLRTTYQARGGLVLPLQATGTSGMEAGLAGLVEPGDVVIVANAGFFGERIVQIARRVGAEVIEIKAELGQHVPNERLVAALDDLALSAPHLLSVLVTHHLEELPASTTHALLLRDGAVVAAGPLDRTVTDAALSSCYGLPLAVDRRDGRLSVRAAPDADRAADEDRRVMRR
jgi:hypothetical protein